MTHVNGVRAVRMHLGLPDATGRQQVAPIAGSHFTIPCDLAIKALGFDPEDLPAMFNEPALAVTKWGTLKVDHRTMMTALPACSPAATSSAAPRWWSGRSATAATRPTRSMRM